MYQFDKVFMQLAIKENAVPMGCQKKFEKLFTEFIRVNGCPAGNKYDGYKKEFLQEVIKKGFELTEEQIHFNYDIHFINQEGDDKDTIGSFFYCIHPFFLNGEMLWHAFGIFGSWKTREIHYFRAENKRSIPQDQEYVISREICNMLYETFKEDDCDSVPEPEPPEFATESPLNHWHKATEKDVQYLALLYLNAGAYGIRQMQLILLIPVRNINGQLINLQRIYSDGSSDFQIDSNIDGGFHRIGTPIDKTIFIAETYTKAANFHEHKTHAVAVAFCKENIENVRAVLQEKYPDYAVLLVDESDETQEINASSDPAPEE